jgi:hypothetical protein
MRNAYQRRLQRQEETEHVPCGENYERLRRLGTQPFSFHWKDKNRRTQPLLMYIDINVGNGRTGRIGVHEGDDLHVLSREFARTHQLNRETASELELMLREAYDANRLATSCSQAGGSSSRPTEAAAERWPHGDSGDDYAQIEEGELSFGGGGALPREPPPRPQESGAHQMPFAERCALFEYRLKSEAEMKIPGLQHNLSPQVIKVKPSDQVLL